VEEDLMEEDLVDNLRSMAYIIDESRGKAVVTMLSGNMFDEAADEIEQLRASLHIAAGKLSTLPPYTDWHPEVLYKALIEDGIAEARRG